MLFWCALRWVCNDLAASRMLALLVFDCRCDSYTLLFLRLLVSDLIVSFVLLWFRWLEVGLLFCLLVDFPDAIPFDC